MKVNKNTRAGTNGKCLACPQCGHKQVVYHFAWFSIACGWKSGGCAEQIEKNDWLVIG